MIAKRHGVLESLQNTRPDTAPDAGDVFCADDATKIGRLSSRYCRFIFCLLHMLFPPDTAWHSAEFAAAPPGFRGDYCRALKDALATPLAPLATGCVYHDPLITKLNRLFCRRTRWQIKHKGSMVTPPMPALRGKSNPVRAENRIGD